MGWTAQEWLAVLGAAGTFVGVLVGGVVTIIKAIYDMRQDVGERLCQVEQSVQTHEVNAAARTEKVLERQQPTPPPYDPKRNLPIP
jgi:hypothetical protein